MNFIVSRKRGLLQGQSFSEVVARYPETQYGRRRFVLWSFPFDIIYRIVEERIEVIALAHHSRRPEYWRAR